MGTFEAVANSSTTIGWAKVGSNSWKVGESNGAMQGAYTGGTASTDSRVGVIVFSGAGAALKDKNITSITLRIASGASGGANNKTLVFNKTKYQYLKTNIYGGTQPYGVLGNLSGYFYDSVDNYLLDNTHNTDLFNNLREYLSAGNSAVCLCNREVATSSKYSHNYARVTACRIIVQYSSGSVYYNKNGVWTPCEAYVRKNDTWVQCNSYYYKNGLWKQTGC